jgi:hypothetical protein
MRLIIAAVVAVTPVVANAGPIYLKCEFDPALDKDRRAPMNVTLNENESTVTWTFSNTEPVFSSKAAFLAGSVAFGSSKVGGETLGGFSIDRTNLTLSERKMDTPSKPITAQTEFTYRFVPVGACKIVQLERAF